MKGIGMYLHLHRQVLRALRCAGLLFLFAFPGCASLSAQDATARAPVRRLAVPDAYYYSVDWVDDTSWVAQFEKRPTTLSDDVEIFRLLVDPPVAQKLSLPVDADGCRLTRFQQPTRLPDGKIAVMRSCYLHEPWYVSVEDLLVWDPRTDTAEKPFPYSLPNGNMDIAFAPKPSGDTIGIVSTSAGLANYMYWLTKDALVPLNLPFERASDPSWSPDGTTIVFKGNKTMPTSANPRWPLDPYDIWTMPSDCGKEPGLCAAQARVLVANIREVSSIQWSPRGKWLAFDGKTGDNHGVWPLHIDRPKELVRVATGFYKAPLWSPDGKRLLIASTINPQDRNATCADGCVPYLIDVSAIVGD